MLQTEQLDLDAIDHRKAVETLRNATIQEQVLSVLETTLDEVKPTLEKAIKQRIQDTAKAGLSQTQSNLPAAFRFLTADSLEAFTLKHAVHVGEKKPAIEGFFGSAVDTLNAHRTNTTNLNQASQQAGLGEIADRLEAVSAEIGRVESNIAQLRTSLASMEYQQNHDDGRIDALRASTSSDSKQQRLIDFIDAIQPVLQDYAERRRDQMAQPLSCLRGRVRTLSLIHI